MNKIFDDLLIPSKCDKRAVGLTEAVIVGETEKKLSKRFLIELRPSLINCAGAKKNASITTSFRYKAIKLISIKLQSKTY